MMKPLLVVALTVMPLMAAPKAKPLPVAAPAVRVLTKSDLRAMSCIREGFYTIEQEVALDNATNPLLTARILMRLHGEKLASLERELADCRRKASDNNVWAQRIPSIEEEWRCTAEAIKNLGAARDFLLKQNQ